MPANEQSNFAARFEYLKALEQHWPLVLSHLYRNTFPVYRTYFDANPKRTALQTLALLSTALREDASAELSQLDLAMRKWAEALNIQERWMWDAAIQTLDAWSRGQTVGKWTYFPQELETPKFRPSFGFWIPPIATWPAFKQATNAIYRRELAAYRAQVGKMWGERRGKLAEHAVWAVYWQQGKSPQAMQRRYIKSSGKTVSLAAIQEGVHAFVLAADVILRQPKAGRAARKM